MPTSGRTGIVGAIEASCPRTARSPACPRPAPARHPRTPASRAVSRPSTVMRRLISLRRVPVARSIPISRVRSRTATSVVLARPLRAMISDNPRTALTTTATWLSCLVKRFTAAARPVTIMPCPRTSWRMAFSGASDEPSPWVRTHITLSLAVPPVRRSAVAGVMTAPQPSRTRAVTWTLPPGPVRVTLVPSGMS